MTVLSDIHFRDPYILPVPELGRYYLFGTGGKTAWSGKPDGFDVYISQDLNEWEGPYLAFRPKEAFWSDQHYWAPEVHHYDGRYYMFASFKADGRCRGTQILVSELPEGPYAPLTNGPATPAQWECLDGTLYIDDKQTPWMIFCREWLQVTDGEIYAVQLKPDLSGAGGDPILLFRASEAAWSVAGRQGQYVTDGPFLHRLSDGRLTMLWSSIGRQGYAMGLAYSQSGSVEGPWLQRAEPVFAADGGHGMLFRDFQGKLRLTIHTPNAHPKERPVLLTVEERDHTLIVSSRAEGEKR